MDMKLAALIVLVIGIFLVGCSSSQPGYAAYNQYPQQQQGQYIGGGCGVAPHADYAVGPTGSSSSAL